MTDRRECTEHAFEVYSALMFYILNAKETIPFTDLRVVSVEEIWIQDEHQLHVRCHDGSTLVIACHPRPLHMS